MTDGLLEEIILLEKEIQQQLVNEEARAAQWQERELGALEQALVEAREKAKRAAAEALAEAREAAHEEGRVLTQSVEQWCQKLESLGDGVLQQALARHLTMIIPEVADDHPHGQS